QVLLVVNSQSNNVAVLPSVGNGFFNDQNPRTIATGKNPVQALVGNFNGPGGLGLITLNAGSNDLTFVSNFAINSTGIELSSGGETPVVAVEGDFNGDGFSDLLVANNGDGVFALFLGEEDGPSIAQTLHDTDIDHPSDMYLEGASGGRGEVFVTEEGQ